MFNFHCPMPLHLFSQLFTEILFMTGPGVCCTLPTAFFAVQLVCFDFVLPLAFHLWHQSSSVSITTICASAGLKL